MNFFIGQVMGGCGGVLEAEEVRLFLLKALKQTIDQKDIEKKKTPKIFIKKMKKLQNNLNALDWNKGIFKSL